MYYEEYKPRLFLFEGQTIFPQLTTSDLICLQQTFSKDLPAPFLGIIGSDVLKDYDGEIDLNKKILALHIPEAKPAAPFIASCDN